MHEFKNNIQPMPVAKTHAIPDRQALLARVREVSDDRFDELSLDIFRYQFACNPVYQKYALLFGKDAHNVSDPKDIPFLPITLFKTHDIISNVWEPEVVFESSATTGQTRSRHAVRDVAFYAANCRRGFLHTTGRSVSDFIWVALLPSYQERSNSSLIWMISDFISLGQPESAFVTALEVEDVLRRTDLGTIPIAFISVSFALLDFAERVKIPLKNSLIIETGGMKGRRTEPTRQELHLEIMRAFGVPEIYSEYGMTELLSQAWSTGNGVFTPSPTLRVSIRDMSDPLSIIGVNARGAINCIDLANVDSCAFIATDDIGISYADNTFEVLGRFDASELRGCNLMMGSE